MKLLNKLMIIMSIIIMCGLVGCSTNESEVSNELIDQNLQQSKTTDQEASNGETKKETISTESSQTPTYTYNIETKNWNVEGITVKYPMIVNSNIQELSDNINDLIMSDMSKVIDTIKGNVSDKTLTIDGVYEYTQIAPTILSICYNIDYSADSLAYPVSLYHTKTIAFDPVAAISLSDLFVIDETFVEDFKSYWMYSPFRDVDLEASGVNIKEEIENQYSNEDLIKIFSKEDAAYYLTEQGLICSIEVPHALGDHLEMAMKYEMLETNMKKDHFLWRDYMFIAGDGFENTNEGEMDITEETVKIGEYLTITLTEDLSIGYSWNYDIEDNEVIRLESDKVLDSSGTDKKEEKQHEWNFKAIKKGSSFISFDYLKTNGERGAEDKTITYRVTVE